MARFHENDEVSTKVMKKETNIENSELKKLKKKQSEFVKAI